MKIRKINTILSTAIATTSIGCFIPTISSCSTNDEIFEKLLHMPNVEKVESLTSQTQFNSRYMVYFRHPIDWSDKTKGTFLQRCEFNFRGLDRINQLFTCGYEIRKENLERNDYEIANHFQGNVIQPEFRFFDKSRPEGLDTHKVEGWENLNYTQAVQDFHSIIESFKTILSNKWVFSGTSKGGETTNAFAMKYPDDCTVYVPYVAPKFYHPQGDDAKIFQERIYGWIGDDVLGKVTAKEYRDTVSEFQYYALLHKHDKIEGIDLFEYFWKPYKDNDFSDWAKNHHENVYDACIQECATQFWQGKQDIAQLKEFLAMEEGQDKLKKCVEIAQGLNDPTSWQLDSLFFPYAYEAKTEMGEYDYDFVEMKKAISTTVGAPETDIEALLCPDEKDERKNFLWHVSFTDEQYNAWINKFDETYGLAMIEWNKNCPVNVVRIYGGCDTWTGLRLDDIESDKVKIYFGVDASNPRNRSHTTRIKGLSSKQQEEVWTHLESILK